MSYSANVPNANQSPGRLPTQAAVNWNRLKDIIKANHNFTDSTSSSEGYHQIVEWVKQTGSPTAIAAAAQTFAEDADYRRASSDITAPHLFHYPTSGEDSNKFPISVVPIRAYVVFDGTGSIGANMTIHSQYNVDTVVKGGGDSVMGRIYTINFVTNLPSAKYAYNISATGNRSTSPFVQSIADILNSSLVIRITAATSSYVTVTIFGG